MPKPLKLLLSQLPKFCPNHISYTSLITVIALNDLRCFGKHLWPKVRVNLRYWRWLNLFVVTWKLTTSQTTILFPLYYDGNTWIKGMQKMKTTSCTILQQTWKHKMTKWNEAFTFDSVHVRSLQIYEYFMVAIIRTIFIMTHHAFSHKLIFVVLDVWFGL